MIFNHTTEKSQKNIGYSNINMMKWKIRYNSQPSKFHCISTGRQTMIVFSFSLIKRGFLHLKFSGPKGGLCCLVDCQTHLRFIPFLSIRCGNTGLNSLNPRLPQLFRVSLKHAAPVTNQRTQRQCSSSWHPTTQCSGVCLYGASFLLSQAYRLVSII